MPPEWSSSPPELLLAVDRTSGRPLHAQLQHGLRDAIRTGRLQVGERLPSPVISPGRSASPAAWSRSATPSSRPRVT
ncbi:hypothetical protein [Streptomyces lydicus]|uniref:hypothetical protein n=1 Tax=Streptomyces lydicus TaxID=47763 RepID=UPI003788F151